MSYVVMDSFQPLCKLLDLACHDLTVLQALRQLLGNVYEFISNVPRWIYPSCIVKVLDAHWLCSFVSNFTTLSRTSCGFGRSDTISISLPSSLSILLNSSRTYSL